MYSDHVPQTAQIALSSDEGFTKTVTFVLCTIQMPFWRTKTLMSDVAQNGEHSKALFGSKRQGYVFAKNHATQLRTQLRNAQTTVDAIETLTSIPGLGVVKAAFVAQLCGFNAACLDTHNLKRLGFKETALKFPKTLSAASKRKRIAEYDALCRQTGGSEYWWNTWCDYVAQTTNRKHFNSANEVSAYHLECLS